MQRSLPASSTLHPLSPFPVALFVVQRLFSVLLGVVEGFGGQIQALLEPVEPVFAVGLYTGGEGT